MNIVEEDEEVNVIKNVQSVPAMQFSSTRPVHLMDLESWVNSLLGLQASPRSFNSSESLPDLAYLSDSGSESDLDDDGETPFEQSATYKRASAQLAWMLDD